ncbi:hypothetical protein ACTFIZ_011784 [Dictyostelium cf. discoideum]
MEENKSFNKDKNNFVTFDPRILPPPPPSSLVYPIYTPPQQQENYNVNYDDHNNSNNTTSCYNEELYKDNSFITLNDRFQKIEGHHHHQQQQQQQQAPQPNFSINQLLTTNNPFAISPLTSYLLEEEEVEQQHQNYSQEKPIEYTHSYVVSDDKLNTLNNQWNASPTSQPYYPIIPPYQPYNDIAPTQEFVNRVALRLREMEIEESNDPNEIHEENIMDASMSMLILLLGMFFFVPFIFSVLYLKSRDKYARRFAIVSMCIGIVYLIMIGIMPFFKGNDDDTTTTIIMS